jgi:arsenate reductase
MSQLKIYQYEKCSTCRKAIKFLEEGGHDFQSIAIRETPPKKKELELMLKIYQGELKRLFNVSGQDYRAMKLKDKLPDMTKKEAIDLLSKNGNLVKRPFVLLEGEGVVGFKLEDWKENLPELF